MENIVEELGVPELYLKPTPKDNLFTGLVHKSWLKSLVRHSKLPEFIEKQPLESSPFALAQSELGPSWTKVFIRIFPKRDSQVVPLPRIRSTPIRDDPPLLFCQLMQYLYQTNYKNLWKDAYKKYNRGESVRETQVNLAPYNDVLREIITRVYGCKIINGSNGSSCGNLEVNLNVLPALCAVETANVVFVIHHPHLEHNLSDCVTFSPAILEKCHTRPLFIVYQLLQTLKSMHDRSLTLGDISLGDIYLTEDLWIYVLPAIGSNLYNVTQSDLSGDSHYSGVAHNYDCDQSGHRFDYQTTLKCVVCGLRTYDKVNLNRKNDNLDSLCRMWTEGRLSNFTYITALNKLSGRKLGDPNCHHVFPWVTDFASRCGKNWRDLKKSKYRLNKGDRQLDLTYDNSPTPHHVSDVLSSITYYVYMARRTPKGVLCKNVRTVWVPAEYPSSVQRMQEWTPDECIPEFFTDPTVFRSCHDDLDDLEVPAWCSGPEDFIDRHREALESSHVSERLHHWIDLTFGYKLSGNAAIKAKNVCLHLVDDHTNLTKSGIVQLFAQPHPQRATSSTFWGRAPPKVLTTGRPLNCPNAPPDKDGRDRSRSPDSIDPKSGDEDARTTAGLTKFLSRSRSSLDEEFNRNPHPNQGQRGGKSTQRSASLGPKNPSFTSHVLAACKDHIELPREFRPSQALENLEKKYLFLSKMFNVVDPQGTGAKQAQVDQVASEIGPHSGFTNQAFDHYEFQVNKNNTGSNNNTVICNYSDIISTRRVGELQVLGCLIVEIFMSKHLRALGATNNPRLSFKDRLRFCLLVLKNRDAPPCISYVVNLLLRPHGKYPAVSDLGLPPPSAHLLLEPLLHCIVPFPPKFPVLFKLLARLKDFKSASQELEIFGHDSADKVQMAQKIGECVVKTCANILESGDLGNLNTTTEGEIVDLLLPHVRQLLEDPPTSVLAAWHLFDPLARLLGPAQACRQLLDSVLVLYENESESNCFNGKIAKLYHHSFLLGLIVRLGLRRFLDEFVTPLVEAVGRYKDRGDYAACHSHLKSMDEQQPARGDSSDDSSSPTAGAGVERVVAPQVEVFDFDLEADEEEEEQMKSLIEELEMNVAGADFGQIQTEEGLDATVSENLEQLRSLEELNLNLDEKITSPTIPIPRKDLILNNITCEVGSSGTRLDLDDKKSLELLLDSPNSGSRRLNPSGSGNSLQKSGQENRESASTKISDVSADSLIWLSHRLGPVLTARYLSRKLLKMLTLCYVGKDNLGLIRSEAGATVSIAESRVVGDQNASKVLECLTCIAGLYGEQFILFQYIPHMSELIALCKRKLTPNLEGGLISCLALLQHVIPYLSDSTLMDQLQDVILKNILHPIVRLLGSTKCSFPSQSTARDVLARKYLDTLYVLSIRMGADMTRTHLAVPALQRFFLIFDKVHRTGGPRYADILPPPPPPQRPRDQSPLENSTHYVELCRDGTTSEWSVGSIGGKAHIRLRDSDDLSLSPPTAAQSSPTATSIVEELGRVFTPELAQLAYLPFANYIGQGALEISLNNIETVRELVARCDSVRSRGDAVRPTVAECGMAPSSSIGSNIALIGNRIDVAGHGDAAGDLLSLVSNKMESNGRHLRGNWLAYWEHEIGRSDKDSMFNFKQIKLQTFQGHTHSVKCLQVLDNENSFVSGSRDRTVKLWSLRSQGDGTSTSTCQWTYTAHKKSVLSVVFVENTRLVASSDGVVHIWDPFMGVNVGHLESPRYAPVNVLRSLPAPSSLFYAATTDGTVKVVDTRLCSYVQELKVSNGPSGLIRCLAIAPDGSWVATGQSSGVITVLECRTGMVVSTWRAHEGEVLQLVAVDGGTVISSSLDQSVAVWNVTDGRFKFHLRGATEPVHCLTVYNKSELISGTTANRIGVHTSVDYEASFSSTKLRSDAFRGLLTSMALLPLNRLLLLGADNGNVNLLC